MATPMRFPQTDFAMAWIHTSLDLTNHRGISFNNIVCAPSKVVKCGSPNAAQRPESGGVVSFPPPPLHPPQHLDNFPSMD